MANLITFIRLAAVFVIAAIALYARAPWQLLNVPLIIINILLDGLDGIIARARHETSVFGAVFDIAADRIIESVLWMILASLNLVSIWVAIILITRGILIDSLRKPHAQLGKSPFSIMKTAFGKFLVASRTMRFTVGFFKLITFSWLFFLVPAPTLWPQMMIDHHALFNLISDILVYTTIIICLARGIPVVLETLLCKDKP
jgi:CDP-diacylglycerol--glycerol-3-phosphate 3-phosphatidyltransferase